MLWAAPLRDLICERLARRLPERLAAPLAEGAGADARRDGRDRAADGAPLRAALARRAARQPARRSRRSRPVMWLGMLIGMLGQLPFVPAGAARRGRGRAGRLRRLGRRRSSPRPAGRRCSCRCRARSPSPRSTRVIAGCSPPPCALGAPAPRAARLRAGSALASSRWRCWSASRWLAAPGAGAGRRAAGAGDACGSPSSTSARATRSCSSRRAATRSWSTAARPGGAAAEALRDLGVERLRAVFLTHDELDHAGGLYEVLAAGAGRRAWSAPARRPSWPRPRAAAGARVLPTAEGGGVRLRAAGRSTCSGRPRDAGEPRAPTRTPTRSCSSPASAATTRCSPATPRPEATHLDPGPARRAQGRPSRLRRRRPRSAPRPLGAAGGADRRRRRQHLRPPDRGDARDPRRARRLHPAHRSRRGRHGRARPAGVAAWTASGAAAGAPGLRRRRLG